eukprot:2210845-Pleurochrysis_carterae.AAC.1
MSRSRSLLQNLATKCSEWARRLQSHVRPVLGVVRELSTLETANYSQMTARNFRASGSKPFQSAAIRGVRDLNNVAKKYRCETKC